MIYLLVIIKETRTQIHTIQEEYYIVLVIFFESDPDLVFKDIIEYEIYDGITGSVNPLKSITIDGTVLFVYDLNTFSINYEYINNKHEDLGDSSDKYRTDEQFVNIINLGFITNL